MMDGNTQLITLNNPQEAAKRIFDQLDVSDATRAEYKARISLFLKFTQENGINHNSYLEFKRFLANKADFSISTKNKYLATAKIFLKELNREGILPVDVTQNIKIFNQSKKHKRDGLNDEEVNKLVDWLKSLPQSPQNARFKAIISLLTLQGLRQIEIIRLDVNDLDLVAKVAYIQGKGQDDKEAINLHLEAVKALKDYLRTNSIASGPLFVSQSNNSRNNRLSTRSIRQMVTDALKPLGIDKTTHGFRHYFTTKLIKTYKGDLLEVAQYTRHKNLEMLQVYNDSIKREADLPRFYSAFEGINFDQK